MPLRKIKLTLGFFLIIQLCNAQIDKFIYDVADFNGRLNVHKVVELLHLNSDKNILLLSEDRHDYKSLEQAKTDLVVALSKSSSIDIVYKELNYADHKLIVDNYFKRFSIDTVIHSSHRMFTEYIRDDYKVALESPYNNFIRSMSKAGLLDRVYAIDIGTSTTHLGIFYFASYTKTLNTERNKIIDWFCDSIRQRYSLEYHHVFETKTDRPEVVKWKLEQIDLFLGALQKADKYKTVFNAWKSIFSSYQSTQYNLKNFPSGESLPTFKMLRQQNSFRDSVLFYNFNFHLPTEKDWKLITVLYSSYHLLDTRNSSLFEEVLYPATYTLGKYLHSRYEDTISHIVFVCNSGILNDRLNKDQNYKKSLEYKLSKSYNFAYVDLKAYRNSTAKKEPFYLRPTFEKFLKLNWETLIDGIVFIKDCGCEPE